MNVIGIRNRSDTPFGECDVFEYRYGDFPSACPDETTCYPCQDAENGAAGAGGTEETATSTRCPKF
jgi:hypothetical protein